MEHLAEMLGSAQWISGPAFSYGEDDAGYYGEHRNHVVSKTFVLTDDPRSYEKRASYRLVIAVLGYASVCINGRRIGVANGSATRRVELLGHWTRFPSCVYYDVFELNGYLRFGQNRIDIELGNGFYNPAPLTMFGKYNFRERLSVVGTPKVLACVECGGSAVVETDGTWALGYGRFLFNNVYLGEVYDAASACATSMPVVAIPNTYHLEQSVTPPVVGEEALEPVAQSRQGDKEVYDVGRTVSALAELNIEAEAPCTVTVQYAETLDAGVPTFETNVAGHVGLETPRGLCPGGPGAPQMAIEQDQIRCPAGVTKFCNRFTWHSFRYAVISCEGGPAKVSVRAIPVHTQLAETGHFSCDNAWMEALLAAAKQTKLNNIHDIFEDCARERLGYGGDMVALLTSTMYLYDVSGLIDKTLADFRREQTPRGGMPETAPFVGIGSNGPTYGEGPLLWQIAYPYLALAADRVYGRRDLLEREWPGIERFGMYLMSFDYEELSSCCLGDHGSVLTPPGGFKGGTPDKEFCGWCAIAWGLMLVFEAGHRLGRSVSSFGEQVDVLRTNIVKRFRHDDGSFGEGTQTSWAFAALLELDDRRVLAARLVEAIKNAGGLLTSGIFGTMLTFDVLNRYGHNDVLERWLAREPAPSFHAMLASGNGVLSETFGGELSSSNHAMFSSYAQWFFQGPGGIRVCDDAVGCDRLIIRPYVSQHLQSVSCSYRIPQGEVSVAWARDETGLVHGSISVPDSVETHIDVPSEGVWAVSRTA